jgi:hypothetical protein
MLPAGFALSLPRRTAASSITSSWYSVARWIQLDCHCGGYDPRIVRSPNCAASSTSVDPESHRRNHQVGGSLGQHAVLSLRGHAGSLFQYLPVRDIGR